MIFTDTVCLFLSFSLALSAPTNRTVNINRSFLIETSELTYANRLLNNHYFSYDDIVGDESVGDDNFANEIVSDDYNEDESQSQSIENFYPQFQLRAKSYLSKSLTSRRFSNHREKRQSLDYNLEGYRKACRITLNMFPQKVIKIISPFRGRKQYPSGLKCEWEIIGLGDCLPVVTCDEIDFRRNVSNIDEECHVDSLTISDGAFGEKQFCGPNLGFTKPMKGRKGEYLYITFSSTPESTHFDRLYKGFHCQARCHNSVSMSQIEKQELPQAEPPKEEFKCLCGRKFNEGNERVVQGEAAKKDEFPWQAALVQPGTRKPFCGGSLINNKFILTAAHCLLDEHGNVLDIAKIGILLRGLTLEQGFSANIADVELGEEGSIRSPGWDLADSPDHSKDDLLMGVDEVIIHQMYNKFVIHEYDIALLRLKRSLPLASKDIPTPVCLPDMSDTESDFTGKIATVSGWGKAHELAGASTRILQKLDVPVLSPQLCQEMYAEGNMEITENMLCAGYEEGGKDACSGDSGGPLIITEGQRSVQVGVVSFGSGCARARRPGVYTRLTKFLPWIRHHTKGSIWPRSQASP